MRRVGRSSCWAILFVLGAALDWGGCPAVAQELPAPPEFFDGFDVDRVIEEAGSMRESLHPDWWVSSGGYFISKDGSGMTVHGRLPADDRWRVAYSISNPIDTEDGYLPQNVFRAVARSKWSDFTQLVYFKIDATNMTDSPNRDAFNGIHLFHRYQDQDNLYYVGVRVDGAAAVKRKLNGKYTTLKYVKIYPGVYDRWANPNLLPQGRWIGLRTVTRTNPDGSVTLSLDIDDGGWTPVLQVTDPGRDDTRGRVRGASDRLPRRRVRGL